MNKNMKGLISLIIIALMIIAIYPIVVTADADDTHVYISYYDTSGNEITDTEIGNTIYVHIVVNTTQEIDTWQYQWINFTQGKWNCPTVTIDTFFASAFMSQIGTILNASGQVGNGTFGDATYEMSITPVNNTNATTANLTMNLVGVGVANITFAYVSGGESPFLRGGNDVLYTFHDNNLTIHPQYPQSFSATSYGQSQVNLSWTKGNGADKTLVKGKLGSYPTGPTDGAFTYNDTGTLTTHTSLGAGEHWYYRSWSWNTTESLLSNNYASGDATTDANNPPTQSDVLATLNLTTNFNSTDDGFYLGNSGIYSNYLSYQHAGRHHDSNDNEIPDYYFWVNESNSSGGELQVAGDSSSDTHGGGDIAFSDNGTLWYIYGGYFHNIPADLWRANSAYNHSDWTKDTDNILTVSGGCSPSIEITQNDSLLLFWRDGASDTSSTETGYRRYDISDGSSGVANIDTYLANGMTFESNPVCPSYIWSTSDPRYNYTFVTLVWKEEAGASDNWGSAPFIYSDNNGTNWKMANGSVYTLPIEYNTATWQSQADIPWDSVYLNLASYSYGETVGVSPDNSFYMTVAHVDSRGILPYAFTYVWDNSSQEWTEHNLSSSALTFSTAMTSGTTKDYIFVAYTLENDNSSIRIRVSGDNGNSWSAEEVVYTIPPDASTESIYGISYCQPKENYTDNIVRLFYAWGNETATGSTKERCNVNWIKFNIGNNPPTVDYKTPVNGSTGVAFSGGVTCYAYTNDTDGDPLDITWATNESGSWVNKYTNTSEAANGTESYTFTDFNTAGTTYWWKVYVNDGTDTTQEWYVFTTRTENEPGAPSSFVATADGRFEIDLTWIKGTKADYTWIEYNTTMTWARGAGSFLYNDTGTSTSLSGLSPDTLRYFQAWSWNQTDGVWSSSYSSDLEATDSNNVPTYSSESPPNTATSIDITTGSVFVSINDAEGDAFNWTIQTSPNIGSDSANGAGNGSKSASISGLVLSTIYTWYINTTDSYNWSNVSYTFTTRDEYTPGPPGTFTATADNRTQISLSWTKGNNADYTYIEYRFTFGTWNRGDETELYNNTGTATLHSGLNPGTAVYYQAWSYNDTDNAWNSSYVADIEVSDENNIPTQSSESPTDDTGNISITQATVSLTIEDVEDTFDWTIQGQYITNTGANGALNGSKSANVITPLGYNTDVIWYVNVTDGYNWTNATYNFTSRLQYLPSAPIAFSTLAYNRTRIDISWSPDEMADKTLIVGKVGSFPTSKTDGTLIENSTSAAYQHTGLNFNEHWYYKAWSWNETDSSWSISNSTNDTSTDSNTAPNFGTPSPTNGSSGQETSFSWSIPINDADGDTFNWTIECNNSDINSANDATNGTKSLSISGLSFSSSYKVWVNATDSYDLTASWFTFTTRSASEPGVPGAFVATKFDDSQIDLTWSKGLNADYTHIRYNSTAYPADKTSGILLYNNTGTATSATSLDAHTTYYFRAWSWNDTDGAWSGSYSQDTATTDNNPVTYGTPTPGNGTGSQEPSLTWSIAINDPDGDTFDWTIECSNSNTSNANGDSNGTKQLSITGLAFTTSYTVWVNTTDSYDWTRAWYTFTTRSATDPNPPSVFAASVVNKETLSISWTLGANSDKVYIRYKQGSIAPTDRTDGTFFYNGSSSPQTLGSLLEGTQYSLKAWGWNDTDFSYSSTNSTTSGTTSSNLAPVLSSPDPTNGSTTVNINKATVSIDINDSEGDLFNWSIQGTYITNYATSGSSNGTKSANIIIPLTWNTTYYWYVNVTDGADIVNETYHFTTSVNATPVVSNLDPYDGETSVELDIGTIAFTPTDAEGDRMDWSVTTAPNVGSGSGNNVGNGSKSISISSLGYSTTYEWTLHVTDGITWNNATYDFTTKSSSANPPNAPVSPSPSHGASNQNIDLGLLSCSCSDPDGHVMNVTFKWGNGTIIGYDYPVTSGSRAEISIGILEFNTTYTWYAIADDLITGPTQSATWSFDTAVASTELTLTPSTYNFGDIDYDANESSTSITMNNSGTSNISTIYIKASDLEDLRSYYSWEVKDAPGINDYALQYYLTSEGTWTTINSTYATMGLSMNSSDEETIKFKLFMPTLSALNETMYGTVYLKYTGSIERILEFDFLVGPADNETVDEYNVTEFLKGGVASTDVFYLPVFDNLTKNTSINLPTTYEGKSWWFFTKTYTISTIKVYGITNAFTFKAVPISGSATSFKIDIDDFSEYCGFAIVPNPGYFQTSEWWFDMLNDARSTYVSGEALI